MLFKVFIKYNPSKNYQKKTKFSSVNIINIIYLNNLCGINSLLSLFGILSKSDQFQSMGARVAVQAPGQF